MAINWKWLWLQVLFPILVPIVFPALCVLFWKSGQPSFAINWSAILDVGPWALIFFSLTLIGGTTHEYWGKISKNRSLTVGLGGVTLAVAIYAAFIVIWKDTNQASPEAGQYTVTIPLLFATILLCHESSKP
jgi:hypothetical protein